MRDEPTVPCPFPDFEVECGDAATAYCHVLSEPCPIALRKVLRWALTTEPGVEPDEALVAAVTEIVAHLRGSTIEEHDWPAAFASTMAWRTASGTEDRPTWIAMHLRGRAADLKTAVTHRDQLTEDERTALDAILPPKEVPHADQ